jgi:hypothetical protein
MVDCSSLGQQVQRDTIIIFVKYHHLLKCGLTIIVDSYVQSTDYHKHSLPTATNNDLFHKLNLLYRLQILISTKQLHYLRVQYHYAVCLQRLLFEETTFTLVIVTCTWLREQLRLQTELRHGSLMLVDNKSNKQNR